MPELLGQKRKRGYKLRKSGGDLTVEFQNEYYVMADTVDQPLSDIYNTPGVPRLGERDGPTIAVGHSAENNQGNAKLYTITVEFSSDVGDDSSGASQQNQDYGDPTTWVPVAKLAFESYGEVRLTDVSGNAFVNSAKEAFESAIARRRTIVRYDFDQFEPDTVDLDTLTERNETLNSVSFLNKDAKTLLLTIREATIGFYFGFRVWRIGYSLAYKKDNWQRRRLDTGRKQLNGDPCTDKNGNPIVGALDGAGVQQPHGTAPAILSFDEFETKAFADFLRVTNLPTA